MAVNMEIFTRNMELTEKMSDYVTKKVSKLDRFLNDIDDIRIDLSYIKSARSASDRQVAQITIRGKGYILRGEERAIDIFTAIDAVMEKIQRQIERYKGKRSKGRGDGTPASGLIPDLETPGLEDTEIEPEIARRKQFILTPMDELEAIEQMKLLGHENFFIFFDGNTNSIKVLYKRRDGTFGLIEPLLG